MGILIVVILVVVAIWFFWRKSKKANNRPNLTVLPRKFVVFDLETTGLKADAHEIIEVGALRVDVDHSDSNEESLNTDTFNALIKPRRSIPKKITEITGITQEEIDANGRSREEVILEFRAFIGDLPLVTYNADFDMSFLEMAVNSVSPERPLKNRVACALKMARQAWPGQKNYKLEELSTKMGLKTDDSHRALGDARRALVVYVHAATRLNRSTH